MRRLGSGLLGFLALASIVLVGSGCQQQNVLRVTSVNDNLPINADLADFGLYTDPTDPEAEPELISITPSQNAELVLQYVEIGSGLPTWTPYQAIVHTGRIIYKSASGVDRGRVTLPLNIAVMADREGRRTVKAKAQLVPASWLIEQYGDDIADQPDDLEIIDEVDGTLTLQATDSLTGRDVQCVAKFRVVVGNLYDDPSRIGN